MSKKHDVILTTEQIQHIRDALREYGCEKCPSDKVNINSEILHGLWDVVCNDVLFSGVKQ